MQGPVESRNRRRTHAEWLSLSPDRVAEVERRWSLRVYEPLDSSHGYVARASHVDAGEVVVKLAVPGIEFVSELEALRECGGRGAVMLLKADPTHGAMMLESVRPGRTLSEVKSDEEATTIATSVMRRLWRPPLNSTRLRPCPNSKAVSSGFGPAWTSVVPFRRRLSAGPRVCFGNWWRPRPNQSCYTAICTTTTSCPPSDFLGSPLTLRVLLATRLTMWAPFCITTCLRPIVRPVSSHGGLTRCPRSWGSSEIESWAPRFPAPCWPHGRPVPVASRGRIP